MSVGNPRQDYIDQAVKRYSSLFTLPTHRKVLLFLVSLCVVGGFFTVYPFAPMYIGVVLGVGFFFITIISDLIICVLLRSEPVYNQRRCSGLSLFSTIVWFATMFLGTAFGLYFGNADVWLRFFLFGFCAVSILRFLVYSATLFKGYAVAFVSALLQPILWLIFVYTLWRFAVNEALNLSFFVFPLVSIPLIAASIFLFIHLINRVGKKTLGVSSMLLLKSFLANWIEDLNGPIENVLESLGTEQTMDVFLLVFKAKGNTKAVVVVPALHPGPFKNVGSSPFPYLIQSALEKRLDCVVAVPHGLFGHELDLASQVQNQKIIDAVLDSFDYRQSSEKASFFMRGKSGTASAGCQIFGDCAVFVLTVAPETTEDLPQQLGFLAIDEAKKHGLTSAIVINAHNSIDGVFRLDELMSPLEEAVVESLERTAKTKNSLFSVGAAKVVPTEFSLEDGMGPGGISAIVVRIGGQTTAYVTIDGNNMVSGLREKILSMLKEVGIDDGEILTTDTHAVSAVVINRRGYYPVGEVMDQEKLIGYIRKVVSEALRNLEPAEVGWQTITVPNVKVIGAKQIEALAALTDKASKQAKRSAVVLFPLVSAVLVALLMLL